MSAGVDRDGAGVGARRPEGAGEVGNRGAAAQGGHGERPLFEQHDPVSREVARGVDVERAGRDREYEVRHVDVGEGDPEGAGDVAVEIGRDCLARACDLAAAEGAAREAHTRGALGREVVVRLTDEATERGAR